MPKISYVSLGVSAIAAVLAVVAITMVLTQPAYDHIARSVAYEVVEQNMPDPGLSAEAIRAIAQDVSDETAATAIADAGLTGDALNNTIEQGIIAFIKSRAQDSGQPSTGPSAAPKPQAQNIQVDPIDPETEPVAGNVDARYQIVTYSDYECPFCKHFWPTLKTVIENYGDDIAVTMRDFPLPFHGQAAQREAVAAQCAFKLGGNDAFWAYSDQVYTQTGSNGQGLSGDTPLVDIAKAIGIDGPAFADCLANDKAVKAGIEADMQSGRNARVRGTPTSVIIDTNTGDTAVIRGAQPLSVMTSALDNLLGGSSSQ